MPRVSSWRQLTAGLVTLAVLGVGAAAVLAFARVGALHGETLRLHAATAHARGVIPGTEVWVAGQKVGLVEEVGFGPPDTDTTARVLLTLEVLESARQQLHRDATIQIQAGGSLIGAPVVAIGLGSPTAPIVREGDTLRTAPQREVEAIRADLAAASAQVPAVLANVRLLGSQLRAARGTLGALGLDGRRALGATAGAAGALASQARAGSGTVGLALRGGALERHAIRTMAQADSVRALLASPGTSLGRLRGDSTLLRRVDAIRGELAAVQAALAEPRGTVGRVVHDAALVRQVAAARAGLDAVAADVRRNPARYVNF